ncbi:MAG: TIGR02584 family CRISPR-associated protein [Spartobacteria bacterium]|nr:TIGR02584 family CRISPR-associated protein [Spartobacteria bacterium]
MIFEAFGASDSLRIMGDGRRDFDDITTPEDSAFAADFILQTLRGLTENPKTKVIASIAGGRKTMSALLLSCMSLLGRPQDEVCHVLINTPFDRSMTPPFYFPQPGMMHHVDATDHPAKDAHIMLSDIPFVRMRDWYYDRFQQHPPSYMQLVNQVQQAGIQHSADPQITLTHTDAGLWIHNHRTALSGNEAALCYVLLQRFIQSTPIRDWDELSTDLEALHQRTGISGQIVWFHDFCATPFDKENIRKWASSIRKKLVAHHGRQPWIHHFLPDMRKQIQTLYEAEQITCPPITADVS